MKKLSNLRNRGGVGGEKYKDYGFSAFFDEVRCKISVSRGWNNSSHFVLFAWCEGCLSTLIISSYAYFLKTALLHEIMRKSWGFTLDAALRTLHDKSAFHQLMTLYVDTVVKAQRFDLRTFADTSDALQSHKAQFLHITNFPWYTDSLICIRSSCIQKKLTFQVIGCSKTWSKHPRRGSTGPRRVLQQSQ